MENSKATQFFQDNYEMVYVLFPDSPDEGYNRLKCRYCLEIISMYIVCTPKSKMFEEDKNKYNLQEIKLEDVITLKLTNGEDKNFKLIVRNSKYLIVCEKCN